MTMQGAVHDHFFGQSSFGTFALVHERNVVKVPNNAPLELLGPLGCGIQTGAGAVMNALKVRPGSSFAAFGGGAVGLSAVMAARVAGATTIIAADVVPSRLALAKELGATHTVNSRETDPVEAVRKITGGGADFTLESSGRPAVLRQAIDALAIRGTCGIVGAPALGHRSQLRCEWRHDDRQAHYRDYRRRQRAGSLYSQPRRALYAGAFSVRQTGEIL